MKLLFDQNLSPSLTVLLADIFPGSAHVFQLGRDRDDDRLVRTFAAENGFILVTKDSDYSDLLTVFGFPPKIIWIRRGNCSTKTVESLPRENFERIAYGIGDAETGIITIY